jgi:hypothetical protein
MPEDSSQFDYPVDLGDGHASYESVGHSGDKFQCKTGAYTHTGAWPAFDYCPFCGVELE